jgi:hypothetical protein
MQCGTAILKDMNLAQKIFIGALLVSILGAPSSQASCTSTREYITTLEFLRTKKELGMEEAESRRVARKVAKGCTGAASRFIRVASVLSGSGLGPHDSLTKGLEFAARDDREAETFVTVFRQAYLEQGLDLDLRASLKMADELTREFEGNTLGVRDDFERLLTFCASASSLNLPKPQCGTFAARLARAGQRWSGGISQPFLRAFEFMREEIAGPKLATGKALELSEKLVSAGPDAPDNFITAYKYATKRKGLDLAVEPALKFATEMGLETLDDSETPAASPSKSK